MAQFPKDFLWGVASSAYQIEGGVKEGGRGESIWDIFSHIPGKTKNGDTGDLASDSFHRWREDAALLKEMGVGAYRFSIAWPRIAPNGDTDWNGEGFAYYDGLIDTLLNAGIVPWVTLYHWDLPQALQNTGGWQNEKTVRAFAAYAEEMGRHFKGRVTHWIPFNEPQCFIGMGCGTGEHAPGLQLGVRELETCWKNFYQAHRMAADALHAIDSKNLVGLASAGGIWYPASGRPEDADAARTLMFRDSTDVHNFSFALALDSIRDRLDFIGMNIYHGTAARMGENGPEEVPYPVGGPRTAMDWPVTPETMEWGPRFIWERYGLPIYITENGLACRDQVFLDGSVHDPQRIDFTTRYLRCLSNAAAAGVDVRGYFHWSAMDNFEWAEGFNQRFGMIYVDYSTGQRIPKDSAAWYADVIRTNGSRL